MFTVKVIGPDGQTQGYEAERFTICERRRTISIREPGASVMTDLSVDRPDGANHVYVENLAGKTIESLHRGSVRPARMASAAGGEDAPQSVGGSA